MAGPPNFDEATSHTRRRWVKGSVVVLLLVVFVLVAVMLVGGGGEHGPGRHGDGNSGAVEHPAAAPSHE